VIQVIGHSSNLSQQFDISNITQTLFSVGRCHKAKRVNELHIFYGWRNLIRRRQEHQINIWKGASQHTRTLQYFKNLTAPLKDRLRTRARHDSNLKLYRRAGDCPSALYIIGKASAALIESPDWPQECPVAEQKHFIRKAFEYFKGCQLTMREF